MKWLNRRGSDNVEDRRSGGAGGKIALGGGAIGIVFLLVQLFLGGDGTEVLNQLEQQVHVSQESASDEPLSAEDQEMGKMVGVMLADNEDVWNKLFAEAGKTYVEPKLVLFRNATTSGCGEASSAIGPFYCPADQKVYIDLSFFDELKNKYGAEGGDFAIAYVIAHEVGHHVQNLLGTSERVYNERQNLSEKESNKLSVALELQADFYAGVWAHHNQEMKNVLEPGDIDEAISAAGAVGDDHLQKMARGYVQPDGFTHGTSEQRIYWFKRGFETGDMSKGDTFAELL
ncbi:KPN_02809 family neutral zinc metallopeptidase [Cytophaga aurantiaca]|uniref:KPN_02809 family neutral zinc metallopeptidase n=1 Tax=Cytophaga aurantiaca TaxID=29530 RepID=UPI000365B52B|nr:neutral zinc metallopeptidase [Cytophaga aurantiaca]